MSMLMSNRMSAVNCIKGEIRAVTVLLKMYLSWSQSSSSSSVTHHDYSYSSGMYQDDDGFLASFRRLNDYLERRHSLLDVDCVAYLRPFYGIVISQRASGPLTNAALTSLSKFVFYGFLSVDCPHAREGIHLVAQCITQCVFEETDWESDELILMKLLELAILCYRCDASSLLTMESMWDVYSTCISIHNHYRASKILKSEAESSLKLLTLSLFSRLHDDPSSEELQATENDAVAHHGLHPSGSDQRLWKLDADIVSDSGWDFIKQQQGMDMSSRMGLCLLLSKVMAVLSDLIDLQRQSLDTVRIALSIVNVALEAGANQLSSVQPLLGIVSVDLCRHLLRAAQSDDLIILNLSLRTTFNLYVCIKDSMKTQLEVLLLSVHLRLLNSTYPNPSPSAGLTKATHSAKEELALDSLLDFCREPSLINDIYSNYDCDAWSTDLFDCIIRTLCIRSVPRAVRSKQQRRLKAGPAHSNSHSNGLVSPEYQYVRLTAVNKLSLDGLLVILRSIASSCIIYRQTIISTATTCLSDDASADKLVSRCNDQHPTAAAAEADIEYQVDQWCDSETHSLAAEEDCDGGGSFDLSGRPSILPTRQPLPSSQCDSSRQCSLSRTTSCSSSYSSCYGSADSTSLGRSSVDAVSISMHAEDLRQRKQMKQRCKQAAKLFNNKPFKADWMHYSLDMGLLLRSTGSTIDRRDPAWDPNTGVHAAAVARFLKNTPGLGKAQIGEYISKGPPELFPFHAAVLKEYVDTFHFADSSDASCYKALRDFLAEFKLPGESQCIGRIMEAFAGKLFSDLSGPHRPFATSDCAFILSFSIIMLHTDLHNSQIPQSKKMTKLEFVRNNRGINADKDLPTAYLEALYDEVKATQIQVDPDITDTLYDFTDKALWGRLICKAKLRQASSYAAAEVLSNRTTASSSFSDNNPHSKLSCFDLTAASSSSSPGTTYVSHSPTATTDALKLRLYSHPPEKGLFLAMARPSIDALLVLWDHVTDDQLVSKLLRGMWDVALVCAECRLDGVMDSFIVLLCVHARDLMTGSRNLPTKPYSRLNMLAHQANYNQWKLDSGHDLAVMLQYPFEFLVNDCLDTTPPPPPPPQQQQHNSSSSATAVVTPQVMDWVESSMIKGELTIKLIFSVMQLSTHSLPQEVYMSLLTLLVWARSRGALPPSLALIEDDFHRFAMASHCDDRSRRLAEAEEVHSSTVATASIYARSCYLRSYGLSLVNAEGLNSGVSGKKHLAHSTAQKNHSSSNSSSSWFGSLGGFLFSSSSSSANDDVHTNHARVMEAYRQSISSTTGLLDLPHLYCNTNASYVVDLKGAPIRPDDELLKIALQDCKPHVMLGIGGHQAGSRFNSNSSEVLYALFDILGRMIVDLLASRDRRVSSLPGRASVPPPSPTQGMQTPSIPRSGAKSPQSLDGDSSHHSATKGLVDDDCGYLDGDSLLSTAAAIVMDAKDSQWLEVVELDAVCVLEWTCSIIFSSYDNLALFWPKMHNLLKMVFEDNVDLFAARSPYFLERCICLILHATVTSISLRIHTSMMGTVTASDAFLREVEVDVDAGLNDVWLSLRLMRGVPSENISNLADRLGAGIHAIIRTSHGQGISISLEQWYMVFSLLSAATSSAAGRSYVWDCICYLVDRDQVNDINFTPCRHLVLRFLQGVFPGDYSDDDKVTMITSTNNSTSATAASPSSSSSDVSAMGKETHSTKQPAPPYVIASMKYLVILTLMVLAGNSSPPEDIQHQHIDKIKTGRLFPRLVSASAIGSNGNKGDVKRSEFKMPSLSLIESHITVNGRRGTTEKNSHCPPQNTTAQVYLTNHANDTLRVIVAEDILASVTTTVSSIELVPHSIIVPRISLPRREELEMLLIETCKLLAALIQPVPSEVSLRALVHLETVLTACSLSSGLSTALWLRIMNDLISRLPLSLVTASAGNRPEATSESVNSYLEIMSMCHKSCDVVFHLVVKNMHILKDEDDFTHLWSRFISIMSTNAQSAHRGQWWHDDMTETLMVLLQLLRLPDVPKGSEKCIPLSINSIIQHSPMVTLTSPISKHAAQSGETTAHIAKTQHGIETSSTVGSNNSYLGLFGWIVGPSTVAPDVGRSQMDAVVEQHPVDDAQLQPANHLIFEPFHDENGTNEEHALTGNHDGQLLVIAWKTICSLHPVFPGHLKSRNLHLYNKLVSAVSYCEYLQSVTTAERQTATTTAAAVGEVHSRSAANTAIVVHSSSTVASSIDVKVVTNTAVVDISSPTATNKSNTAAEGARVALGTRPGLPLTKTPRTNTKSISSVKAAKPQIV